MLYDSLANCVVVRRTVVAQVHDPDTPEFIAEVADLMLRLEDVRFSVCYGLHKGVIHLSARAVDARSNAVKHFEAPIFET